MPALQSGAAWAEERLLGALQQSVPQNGRVHLLGIDSPSRLSPCGGRGKPNFKHKNFMDICPFLTMGFSKDFYRKGNSVKRSGPFSESADSEN